MGGAGIIRFGAFEYDPSIRELRKGRTRLRVPDQSLAILGLLLERPGEMITREEIRERLWPHGTVVEFEHSVNTAVKRLRQALLDDAATPRYIETLPRRGYRFIAAVETAGPLVPPHYRILGEVGRGAMGVVYRAEDLRLGRQVALKSLPPELASDPHRKSRLIREARAASALNHPNIVTVHDVTAEQGTDYIVMEYVAGKPLGELIPSGGMPLKQAIGLAIQIADALAAAHAAGIIHRDLKPGNIMVTDEGRAKLLDFGVAKLSAAEATAAQTSEGAVIGTSGYMSPEQAEGKPVDARSDIFSFGAVLHEMVTGSRAFYGETQRSTLTAILHQEPKPISQVTGVAQREIETLVYRCLRKDPNRRFQYIIDVKVALEELKEDSEAEQSNALTPVPKPRRRLLIPVVAAGLLAIAAALWLGLREPEVPVGLVLARLTSDSGLTTEPALSPDGKLVAYSSDRSGEGNLDVWVQQVSGGEAIRLTRDPADDREPSFSPDGQRIVFRSDRDGGGIYVVSALGGTDWLLARHGRGPRFSPDGSRIVYWVGARGGSTAGEIYLVEATGGSARRLELGLPFAQSPVWSPDGKRILFVGGLEDSMAVDGNWDWWICPLEGGRPVRTGVRLFLQQMRITGFRQAGSWLAGDRVVFSARLGASTNLWELSLSSRTGRVEGSPRRLTTGPGPEIHPSASDRGQIVFANQVENLDVWWLPVEANRGKVVGEPQRLTQNAASDHFAMIAPDGRKLLFVSDRSGSRDVWIKDLGGGKETPLTLTPFNEMSPAFSRDGSKVVYNRPDNGKWPIYAIAAGQPGVPEKVCDDCGVITGYSSDASRVLYTLVTADGRRNRIELLDVTSRERTRLLEHPKSSLFVARFSPDDRWISFHGFTRAASRRIYVAPFRGSAPVPEHDWVPVTDGAGLDRDACWSPDGNLLYFYSERDGFRCIWAQRLHAKTKHPTGTMFPVYHAHHARRSVMNIANLWLARLSAAPGWLVFSMGEYSGDIWMGTARDR